MALPALAQTSVKIGQQVVPESMDLLLHPAPVTAQGDRKLLLQLAAVGSRLFAVGTQGLILTSLDAGRSWQQVSSPVSVMLTAITMSDTRRGVTVGHDGVVLTTEDGGSTWIRRFDGRDGNLQAREAARRSLQAIEAQKNVGPAAQERLEKAEDRVADAEAALRAGPSRPLFGVALVNAQIGFVAGAFGQLFQTSDGGQRWSYVGDRLDNPDGLHLNRIQRLSSGDLWVAAEAGKLFRSRDAGGRWERVDLGYTGHLYGVVEGRDRQTLLAYGFGGHVFRSEDAGEHWRAVTVPTRKALVDAVLDGPHVWMLTQNGDILVSRDSGNTFQLAGRLPGEHLNGLLVHEGWMLGVGLRGVSRLSLAALRKEQ